MTEAPSDLHRLILDVDTGIDDALALLYAVQTPGVEVLGVGTVSGNIDAMQAATNTLIVLESAGQVDIPVAIGCRTPLVEPFRPAAHVHGADGLGDVVAAQPRRSPTKEHAADQIVRLARHYPGQVTLIATGPLTNLALALRLAPDLPALIRNVVIMGGAISGPGNISAVAEANIGHDPEAAAIVFAAPWSITLVPLDATLRTRLTTREFDLLAASESPVARFASAIIPYYRASYRKNSGHDSIPLHDPLAVGIALDDDLLLDAPYAHTVVELSGQATRGMVVADLRTYANPAALPRIRICLRARSDVFVAHLMDRLLAPRLHEGH